MKTDAAFTSVEADQIQSRLLLGCVEETVKNTDTIDMTIGNFTLTNAHIKNKIININKGHATNLLKFPTASGSNGLVQSLINPTVGDTFFIYICHLKTDGLNTDINVSTYDSSVTMIPSSATFKISSNTNRIIMCRITSISTNQETYEILLF
jgi:hypothetical protein|tara:strand:+ start:8128 stop:8583 length:456 start_codon:yes stop_codon:yes gene_type:complete